ncbi:MAG: hypothetical protein A4E62_00920 [Syntrophorhabdus sp. PtaU1.Bin002]|nr:MAG: hypothetical protein A4E58_00096 [Syntrophorhabdus sp. PtaB.Bin006]OPY72315.1 MAG: hypothetical protein A4E62_00920 [Syntrophorhabdus sp. PtaU1.Bin002]
MKIRDLLSVPPERIFLVIVGIVVCATLWASYGFYADSKVLDQKISTRQNELARIVKLREIYLSNMYRVERAVSVRDGRPTLSLSLMEEMVSKTFVGGKLNMLKPSTLKEQRGSSRPAIELKVTGAALAEVVSFVKGVESAGLSLKKFYLTLPPNQTVLDMYIMVAE